MKEQVNIVKKVCRFSAFLETSQPTCQGAPQHHPPARVPPEGVVMTRRLAQQGSPP